MSCTKQRFCDAFFCQDTTYLIVVVFHLHRLKSKYSTDVKISIYFMINSAVNSIVGQAYYLAIHPLPTIEAGTRECILFSTSSLTPNNTVLLNNAPEEDWRKYIIFVAGNDIW